MKTTNNIKRSERRRARKNNGAMLLMSLACYGEYPEFWKSAHEYCAQAYRQ